MGRPSERGRISAAEIESGSSIGSCSGFGNGLEGLKDELRERLGSSSCRQVDEDKRLDTAFYQSLAPLVESFQEGKRKSLGQLSNDNTKEEAPSCMGLDAAQQAAASSQLIPGLPDDLALMCLAWVPWKDQVKLTRVCKAWAAFLWSDYIYTVRTREGTRDTLLVVLSVPITLGPLKITMFDANSGAVDLSDPLLDVDHPSTWSGFLRGFRCVVVGPDLYIMGGRHDGVKSGTGGTVWRLNFIRRQWTLVAPLSPRRDFACSVVNGDIYVAGGTLSHIVVPQGFGGRSPVLRSAERYIINEDKWVPLPDLNIPRQGCLGGELDGRFYVIGGGGDNGNSEFEIFRSAEVYDPATNTWTLLENMWQSESELPRALTSFNHSLFAVDSDEQMLKIYNASKNLWTDVTGMPFGSTNVSPKWRGNRPSRYQALGGVPGDQLVDFPDQGLLWIGPSGFSSHSMLSLQQDGVVATDWSGHDRSTLAATAEIAAANETDSTADDTGVAFARTPSGRYKIPRLKMSYLIISAASIKI